MGRKKVIKRWVKNDNISLSDMYDKCYKIGWCDYYVETQEVIREYIIENVRKNIFVATLLQSIEEDTGAEYFKVDLSGWSNQSAQPIYTKEELAEALGADK